MRFCPTFHLFRSFFMRVFRAITQQDMEMYIQTAFVCTFPAVRFASSPSLSLLKSNVILPYGS